MLSRLLLLVVTAAMVAPAFAQPGRGPGMGEGERPRRLPGDVPPPELRFEDAPRLGERIPDLTIHDDQGNPVNIREMATEEGYTVLVLGCLT